MKRLFTAVKIHPDPLFLQYYHDLRNALQAERIKWVEPAQMHITLKFFGQTDDELIPSLSMALGKAASAIPKFPVQITGAGTFGKKYAPRVIWFGIRDEHHLNNLYLKIHDELSPLGYVPDNQQFIPHLTLARIKEEIRDKELFHEKINEMNSVSIQHAWLTELHLYESRLFSHGPEYIILESFPFS